MNLIYYDVDGDKRYLRVGNDNRIKISGRYVCAGDDVYDAGFTVDQVKNAKKVTLTIGKFEVELHDA